MSTNQPHIFINHALEDNKAQSNTPGWVESFSYVFKLLASQIMRKPVEVHLREETKESDLDSKYFQSTDALINIYSQAFESDATAKKIKEDYIREKKDEASIFKVLKSPIQDKIDGNIYEFFSEGEDDVWNSELENDHSKEYWLKVVDMSYDVAKSLKKEKSEYRKSVFLAETTPDQKSVRDAIKRDLKGHGYQVLPEAPLSQNKGEMEKQILHNIETSDICIHILGEKYGNKDLLKDLSIVDFQNKITANYCKNNPDKLQRIIWISPDHKNTDLEQVEYLNQLRKNKDELASAELIQTPVEILKSIVHKKLSNGTIQNKRSISKDSKTPEEITPGGIYVIHDKDDKESVKPLIDWLKKNNYKVLIPDFSLQHYNLMMDHKQKMSLSDSVLIFCDHGNIQWSKTKIKDIMKAPGFGRVSPFKFKCLYIASDHNKELLTQIDKNDFIIIENTEDFSASLMAPVKSA